jgi:hypothetical protein
VAYHPLSWFGSTKGSMMPVLIIRHSEKAEEGPHLSERGWRRAHALVGLFTSVFRPPDRLIAAADTGTSSRPRETLEPLARHLGSIVNADTRDTSETASIISGFPDRDLVLVSWRHEAIPALARALGANNVPDDWPDTVFDRIWRLAPVPENGLCIVDMPQALLPGDACR